MAEFKRIGEYKKKVNLRPPLVRFLANIDKRANGCWIWTACTHVSGYGTFSIDRIVISAHRAAWVLLKGRIPRGLLVCHKCDVPACVNPDHLFLGTQKDNMVDKHKKGRANIPRGEGCGTAVLTDEKVREIRRLKMAGVTYKELGKRFGVHPIVASNAARGISWGHIVDVPPVATAFGARCGEVWSE